MHSLNLDRWRKHTQCLAYEFGKPKKSYSAQNRIGRVMLAKKFICTRLKSAIGHCDWRQLDLTSSIVTGIALFSSFSDVFNIIIQDRHLVRRMFFDNLFERFYENWTCFLVRVRVVHMYTDRVPTERRKMRARPSQAHFVNYLVQYNLVFNCKGFGQT